MFDKFIHRLGLVLALVAFVMFASLAMASPTLAQGPTGKGNVTKPKPPAQAKAVAGTADWDKLAADAATSLGFKNYVYEAWELPANSTWDDTVKYYNDQLKQAGWSGDGVTQDITGGKLGAWVDSTTSTGVVIVFVASPDGTKPAYDFAIFGLSTPTPKGNSAWTALPATDALNTSAGALAKAMNSTDYVVQAFAVPASTQWSDVFKYYNDQMTQAGWSGQGVEQQLDSTTKLGVYYDKNTKSGLVVMLAQADASTSVVIAVFGWTTAPTSGTTSSASSSASSSSASSSTASVKGNVTKPKPPAQAKAVAGTADWDKLAADAATSLGFKNYVYEAWELPANSTWDDTFKYYNDQLKQAGWSGDGVTQDITGGKLGAWVDPTTSTGIVLVFVASPDGTKPAYDFAIFGLSTPTPKGNSAWTALPATDALNTSAGALAKAMNSTDYVVQAFAVPASTQWSDVFKYYNDQMTQAGWSGQGVEQQLDSTTKMGVYYDATTKSGLVVMLAQADSSTSVVIAVFGWTTAK